MPGMRCQGKHVQKDRVRTGNYMRFPKLQFRLPDWVGEFLSGPGQVYRTIEERMRLVIELSRLNVAYETGGPFGAGIFDQKTHKLLAPGINMVVQTNCAVLHAEIIAIMLANLMVRHYDLGGDGMPAYEMVVSAEPCAMCIGAITWSGIRRIVCGAREEDARDIGFDEGPKAPDWVKLLAKRGITFLQDVCREEAAAVLRHYLEKGGTIYNGRQGMK